MSIAIEYRHSPDVTVDDLAEALDGFWEEAATDEVLAELVRGVGVDPELFGSTSRADAVSVTQTGAGFDVTGILIVIAPVALKAGEKVAKDLWEQVILPWIKQKMLDDEVLTPADE